MVEGFIAAMPEHSPLRVGIDADGDAVCRDADGLRGALTMPWTSEGQLSPEAPTGTRCTRREL